MSKISVMIADDNAAVRDGLSCIITAQPDMEMVAAVGNGLEAVHLANSLCPDVILMDADMPVMSGIEASGHILLKNSGTRIILLTTQYGRLEEAYNAGISSYVYKDCGRDELLGTVRNTARKITGQTVIKQSQDCDYQ